MVAARLWAEKIPFRIAVGSQMGVCVGRVWTLALASVRRAVYSRDASWGDSSPMTCPVRQSAVLSRAPTDLWGRSVPGASVGSPVQASQCPQRSSVQTRASKCTRGPGVRDVRRWGPLARGTVLPKAGRSCAGQSCPSPSSRPVGRLGTVLRWGSPSSRPDVLSPGIQRHPWLTPDWV